MKTRRILLGCVLLASGLGCTGYETLDLNRRHRAGHFVKSKEQSGLVVAAESHYDARKSEMHFWFDLGSQGFIPSVLYFENLSDRGFVLTPKGISLFLRDGTELKPVPAMEVVEECRYSIATSIIYFPFFIFVGPILSGMHRAQLNFDMEVDYRQKDLYRGRSAIRIPPRSSQEGAVFFRLGDRRDVDLSGAIVKIALTREKGTGESASAQLSFQVPLE
ncbi:MAG: hypothetical protein ACYTHM_16215 [Planctomycetota bacterium]